MLPAAVTWKEMIPIYVSQKGVLATYTTLACLLTLALLFYCRHRFAASMLRRDPSLTRGIGLLLPLLFVVLSATLGVLYLIALGDSIDETKYYSEQGLQDAPFYSIRDGWRLMSCYILMFVSAEAALFLMALREYVQDMLRLTDERIIDTLAITGSKKSVDAEPGKPAN